MRIAMLSKIPSLWECLPAEYPHSPPDMKKAATMDDAKLQIANAPLDDPELPERLDPDFYREALLHIARLTAARLLRERSASADIERRAKIPLGPSHIPDAITAHDQ